MHSTNSIYITMQNASIHSNCIRYSWIEARNAAQAGAEAYLLLPTTWADFRFVTVCVCALITHCARR